MNIKKLYYFVLTFCCLTCISAQEIDSVKNFPVHVSVLDPFWTDGVHSENYSYKFSLNLLAGIVGSVNGLEISGLLGMSADSVIGGQIAGLANTADGKVKGVQIAGLVNFTIDKVTGMQIAGLTNVVPDEMKGVQIAGLTNLVPYDMKGVQIAGLINFVTDTIKGVQIAGLANIVFDKVKGLQIAGLTNLVPDEMKGVQIAGIYNSASKLNGLQIGIVSVNDAIEKGISISLINIVKKGAYKEWELYFADYSNIALSYKMGTQKFYTIYTAGVNCIEDNLLMFGIGFGNRTQIGSRFYLQPEIICSNYFPSNFKDIQNTYVSRLKLGFVYQISKKFGLSLAPSVYLMNADKGKNAEADFYKTSPFNALYKHRNNFKQTSIGVGISLGLNLK